MFLWLFLGFFLIKIILLVFNMKNMYLVHFQMHTGLNFSSLLRSSLNFFSEIYLFPKHFYPFLLPHPLYIDPSSCSGWFTIYMQCIPLGELSRVGALALCWGEQVKNAEAPAHQQAKFKWIHLLLALTHSRAYWPAEWSPAAQAERKVIGLVHDRRASPPQRAAQRVYLPLRADVTRKTILIEGLDRFLHSSMLGAACVPMMRTYCLRFSARLQGPIPPTRNYPQHVDFVAYCVVLSGERSRNRLEMCAQCSGCN